MITEFVKELSDLIDKSYSFGDEEIENIARKYLTQEYARGYAHGYTDCLKDKTLSVDKNLQK